MSKLYQRQKMSFKLDTVCCTSVDIRMYQIWTLPHSVSEHHSYLLGAENFQL